MFIFLMCSERSGSNFITKLMNGHPELIGPSTKHILNPVLKNYFRYGNLAIQDNWLDLLADIVTLFKVDFSIWKTELSVELLLTFAEPGDLPSLLKNLFLHEARLHGKTSVFVKENKIYEFYPYLVKYFGESKFVYQVRDPRDMALSWKLNKNIKGGVVEAAQQWKKDQQGFMAMRALLKDQVYTITYENMVTRPEAELTSLCQFLGLEYAPKMLEFYLDELTQKNAQMNSAWSNLSKGIMENNCNKYRDLLSAQEVKAVEKVCFHEMKQLDYATDNAKAALDKVSMQELDVLSAQQRNSLEYAPVKGIRDNMVAKARFYQK